MNKLGFYIEVSTVQFMRDALNKVKPPTILFHAGDRGLLKEIRQGLSPASFIIGRWFVPQDQQTAWLEDPNPDARGRDLANKILNYDMGYATEEVNGHRLVDAWMGINEALRGPASFPNEAVDAEFKRRAAALDRFQVAFRDQLQTAKIEAVAFNFGAGNYTKAAHYLDWFPKTLASYKYLGFHEYGWPTLMKQSGTETAALLYRACMAGIRNKYGDRHRVIITEAGLARMYKYPNDPAGDVGWLYPGETISEARYWESLGWYNTELVKDAYVLGACLFEVGHSGGRWETFRHLGVDNQQQPILLMDKIAQLNNGGHNGNGNGNGKDGDLHERVVKLKTDLTTAASQVTSVSTQIGKLKDDLDKLASASGQFAGLGQQVSDLVTELDALASRVEQSDLANKAALQAGLTTLRGQLTGLQPAAKRAAALPGQVSAAQAQLAPLVKAAEPLPALNQEIGDLLADVLQLEKEIPGGAPPSLTIQDIAASLASAPNNPFATRPLTDIRRVIVHHTGMKPEVTPQRIAEALVGRGKQGIPYHFMVAADGALYRTQPLESVTDQTFVTAVNADGVAVCLMGDFTNVTPPPGQLAAAARLIAWLLKTRGLTVSAIFGRREVDGRSASPGNQWMDGAKYRDQLLAAVGGG